MIKDQVKFFKGLGDGTRLKIIKYLLSHEGCVYDITSVTRKKQTTISRHLKVLVEAGILKYRKDGKNVIYSIKNPEVRKIILSFGIKPKCKFKNLLKDLKAKF